MERAARADASVIRGAAPRSYQKPTAASTPPAPEKTFVGPDAPGANSYIFSIFVVRPVNGAVRNNGKVTAKSRCSEYRRDRRAQSRRSQGVLVLVGGVGSSAK